MYLSERRFFSILFACLLPLFSSAQNSDVSEIIRRHIEAKGGAIELNRLESIRIEGIHRQNGEESQFILHKKRPNSIRYELTNESLNALFGYNGEVGWVRKQQKGEPQIMEYIEGPALSALIEEARFESPLTEQNNDGDDAIGLVDDVLLNGKRHYVVSWAHDDILKARYYLDVTTYLLSKREMIGEDGSVELTTYYEDYTKVNGYSFAFSVTNEIDGKVLNIERIQDIRVNPGILSFYFEKPLNSSTQ